MQKEIDFYDICVTICITDGQCLMPDKGAGDAVRPSGLTDEA